MANAIGRIIHTGQAVEVDEESPEFGIEGYIRHLSQNRGKRLIIDHMPLWADVTGSKVEHSGNGARVGERVAEVYTKA